MDINNIRLELRGPQTGLSMYDGDSYIATYRSVNDCIMDLIYRYQISEFEEIISAFNNAPNRTSVIEPYKYRGVCSEMFWPTDTIFRYVYYDNTLAGIFEKFSYHEQRAIRCEQHFSYGVQGTGIHLFNPQTSQYEMWVGGNLKSVSDIMAEAKKQGKIIPDNVLEEYKQDTEFDVFISHKSEDYAIAKKVYDVLTNEGFKVFLSEISLVNIANSDYTSAIDETLEKTHNMVVIATSIEKINSGWVQYEWSSFLNEKRSGRKKGNLITVVVDDGIIPTLPYALRQFEVMEINRADNLKNYLIR